MPSFFVFAEYLEHIDDFDLAMTSEMESFGRIAMSVFYFLDFLDFLEFPLEFLWLTLWILAVLASQRKPIIQKQLLKYNCRRLLWGFRHLAYIVYNMYIECQPFLLGVLAHDIGSTIARHISSFSCFEFLWLAIWMFIGLATLVFLWRIGIAAAFLFFYLLRQFFVWLWPHMFIFCHYSGLRQNRKTNEQSGKTLVQKLMQYSTRFHSILKTLVQKLMQYSTRFHSILYGLSLHYGIIVDMLSSPWFRATIADGQNFMCKMLEAIWVLRRMPLVSSFMIYGFLGGISEMLQLLHAVVILKQVLSFRFRQIVLPHSMSCIKAFCRTLIIWHKNDTKVTAGKLPELLHEAPVLSLPHVQDTAISTFSTISYEIPAVSVTPPSTHAAAAWAQAETISESLIVRQWVPRILNEATVLTDLDEDHVASLPSVNYELPEVSVCSTRMTGVAITTNVPSVTIHETLVSDPSTVEDELLDSGTSQNVPDVACVHANDSDTASYSLSSDLQEDRSSTFAEHDGPDSANPPLSKTSDSMCGAREQQGVLTYADIVRKSLGMIPLSHKSKSLHDIFFRRKTKKCGPMKSHRSAIHVSPTGRSSIGKKETDSHSIGGAGVDELDSFESLFPPKPSNVHESPGALMYPVSVVCDSDNSWTFLFEDKVVKADNIIPMYPNSFTFFNKGSLVTRDTLLTLPTTLNAVVKGIGGGREGMSRKRRSDEDKENSGTRKQKLNDIPCGICADPIRQKRILKDKESVKIANSQLLSKRSFKIGLNTDVCNKCYKQIVKKKSEASGEQSNVMSPTTPLQSPGQISPALPESASRSSNSSRQTFVPQLQETPKSRKTKAVSKAPCAVCKDEVDLGDLRLRPILFKYQEEPFDIRIFKKGMVCLKCYLTEFNAMKGRNFVPTFKDFQNVSASKKLNKTTGRGIRSLAFAKTIQFIARNLSQNRCIMLADALDVYTDSLTQIDNLPEGSESANIKGPYLLNHIQKCIGNILSIHSSPDRKLGTLLYPTGLDTLSQLHVLTQQNRLHKNDTVFIEKPVNTPKVSDDLNFQTNLYNVCNKLNSEVIPEQGKKFNEIYRSNYEGLMNINFDNVKDQIDPILWNVFALMLLTGNERKKFNPDKFKWNEHFTAFQETGSKYETRKILRLTMLICMMLFVRDEKQCYPMQVLISDIVHKYSNSTDLQDWLSRLGFCVSSTAHQDFRENVIKYQKNQPTLKGLKLNSFLVVTLDNLDKNFPWTAIISNLSRSWHGTTIMIIQPKQETLTHPSLNRYLEQSDSETQNEASNRQSNENQMSNQNDPSPTLTRISIFGDGRCFWNSIACCLDESLSLAERGQFGVIHSQALLDRERAIVSAIRDKVLQMYQKNLINLETKTSDIKKKHLLENQQGKHFSNYNARLEAMKNDSFVGELEILITAFTLQRQIRLYQDDRNDGSLNRPICYPDNMYEDRPISVIYKPDRPGSPGHYDPYVNRNQTFDFFNLDTTAIFPEFEYQRFINVISDIAELEPPLNMPSTSNVTSNLAAHCNDHHSYASTGSKTTCNNESSTSSQNGQFGDHSYNISASDESQDVIFLSSTPKLSVSPEFYKLKPEESTAKKEFEKYVFQHSVEKYVSSMYFDEMVVPCIKGKLIIESPNKNPERSTFKYHDILSLSADKVETVKGVLDNLRAIFTINGEIRNVLVTGDQKVFRHLKELKETYKDIYDFVYPFIGDFHVLLNYQDVLINCLYYKAGLEELCKCFHQEGSTAQMIETSKHFKHRNRFLKHVYEAIYRVQIDQFFRYRECGSTDNQLTNENIFEQVKETISHLKDYFKDKKDKDENVILSESLDHFLASQKVLFQSLSGVQEEFNNFRANMCEKDETFAFWDNFLHNDFSHYIGLLMALRTENWNLRVACIKGMAPLFHICDRQHYSKLMPEHLVDLDQMPEDILFFLENGGFTANITGTCINNLGLDETHEMTINRDVKQAITNLNQIRIEELSHYLTWRAKCLNNFFFQLGHGTGGHKDKSLSKTNIQNNETVVKKYISLLQNSQMFFYTPTGRPLHHIFTKKIVAEEVARDMNQLYKLSNERFSKFMVDKYVKKSSIDMKLTKYVLKTFGSVARKKANTSKQLSDEKMHNEYLRRLVKFSEETGIPVARVGQLMKLPRAIANENGTPYKNMKASAKEFYRKRYKTHNIFSLHMPTHIQTQAVVIDAMNIIHILEPSRQYENWGTILVEIVPSFSTYAQSFLSYVKNWLTDSVLELHIVFDNFNRTNYPKNCERTLRDSASNQGPAIVISGDTETPKDWKSFLTNRQNKYNLLNYLCREFMTQASAIIQNNQTVFIAGGFSGDLSNKAYKVTVTGCYEIPELYSSHDEADSRIWLHASKTNCKEVLIVSKDTDLYHIGLPILSSNRDKNIYMQLKLTRNYSNDDRYLHLNTLLTALENDTELSYIPQHQIPLFALLTYIASGCDFTSSFYQIGKAKFMEACFKEAKFIYINNTVAGNIFNINIGFCPNCEINQFCDQCSEALDCFLCGLARMIGTVYFYKIKARLNENDPCKLFDTCVSSGYEGWDAHSNWLSLIREETFRTAKFEDTCLPSDGALKMHSLRTLWVFRLWTIASQNGDIPLEPSTRYGFNDDGSYKWDTDDNMSKIQAKVDKITKGCGCQTGCRNNRCLCKKADKFCGPGCTCIKSKIGCFNVPKQNIPNKNIVLETVQLEENDTEHYDCPEYDSEEEVYSQSETEDEYLELSSEDDEI